MVSGKQSKQELNGAKRGKPRETFAKSWVLSIMPKIPEISVAIQMARPLFVSFWPEYSGSPLEVVYLF